jgi:hypothetical protein
MPDDTDPGDVGIASTQVVPNKAEALSYEMSQRHLFLRIDDLLSRRAVLGPHRKQLIAEDGVLQVVGVVRNFRFSEPERGFGYEGALHVFAVKSDDKVIFNPSCSLQGF